MLVFLYATQTWGISVQCSAQPLLCVPLSTRNVHYTFAGHHKHPHIKVHRKEFQSSLQCMVCFLWNFGIDVSLALSHTTSSANSRRLYVWDCQTDRAWEDLERNHGEWQIMKYCMVEMMQGLLLLNASVATHFGDFWHFSNIIVCGSTRHIPWKLHNSNCRTY